MTEEVMIGTAENSARMCHAFFDSLLAEGFTRDEAILVVAAWFGRPQGSDVAGLNAVMQNMVAALKGDE